MNKDNIRIQDDLYEAINGEWIKNATIPADRPTAGGFSDLDQGVEKLLMSDFKDFADGKKSTDIKEMNYAIEIYKKCLNTKERNEAGIKPLLPILSKINSLKNVDDLNKAAKELFLLKVDLPFNFGVTADMKDATKNSFIIMGPSTILPDTSYYAEGNQAGAQLLEVWKNIAKKLLAMTPLSSDEQAKYLEDAIAFDALVAKKVKSQLEWADYTKCHNPMSLDEVSGFIKPFDLKYLLNDIYGKTGPDTIVVYDPKAIKELNGYFNNDTFELYVHWAYVNAIFNNSSALSEEISALGTEFRRTMMGIQADAVLEKKAYQLASRYYSDVIGVYYGRTYFGEEAKKDVVNLVKQIIETYKVRVKNNEFLAESTKEKAILKLSTIVIKMGYPDEIDLFYSTLKVTSEESYFDALSKISKLQIMHQLEKLNKPVDRKEWGMPGHMVNACYNPSANDITFPAAILQKPFYSINQTVSENLGGIGVVIGHEISHAFDNNGAQFDENGNLFNWWTENDYKEFQKRTKAMIDEFDGVPLRGGKVNGELVVSENIADNGGMAVSLEIMSKTKNANYEEFFVNYAKIWCMKASDEYVLYLLANDVHAPAVLRVNLQVRNFDEWYKTFDVKDTDQMYLEPSKRVHIW